MRPKLNAVWHMKQLAYAVGIPASILTAILVYTKYLDYSVISPRSEGLKKRLEHQRGVAQHLREELSMGPEEPFFNKTEALLLNNAPIGGKVSVSGIEVDDDNTPASSTHNITLSRSSDALMDRHSSAIYSDLRYTYSRIKRLDRLSYALYAELQHEELTGDEGVGSISSEHVKRLNTLLVHLSEADAALKSMGVADYSSPEKNLASSHDDSADAKKDGSFSFEKFRNYDNNMSRTKLNSNKNQPFSSSANSSTLSTASNDADRKDNNISDVPPEINEIDCDGLGTVLPTLLQSAYASMRSFARNALSPSGKSEEKNK